VRREVDERGLRGPLAGGRRRFDDLEPGRDGEAPSNPAIGRIPPDDGDTVSVHALPFHKMLCRRDRQTTRGF
jgi:hypothetical protein